MELLFKWIKQNLKIKHFIGKSKNVVMIQIYVALIAYILLQTHNKLNRNTPALRLKDTLTTLRFTLFSRPKIYKKRLRHRTKKTQNQLELWSYA
ncbi:hypothetical protein [Terasakiella sp. A23]|uniref:hypothetical protein n=1 Tax=Terasakiella sp. FCG-A23 TaxID=3080561 RepID=UPI0039863EB1